MQTQCGEVGFDGPTRPDHVPTMEGDEGGHPGYALLGQPLAVGYMKGLIQGVNAAPHKGSDNRYSGFPQEIRLEAREARQEGKPPTGGTCEELGVRRAINARGYTTLLLERRPLE